MKAGLLGVLFYSIAGLLSLNAQEITGEELLEKAIAYHDESKNDGEYILLSGLEDINGIQMPKKRDWYYNSNDKFLGSDLLIPNEGVITSGKNSSRP